MYDLRRQLVLGQKIGKGIADEFSIQLSLGRQSIHNTGGCRLLEDFKVEDLLSGITKTDSPSANKEIVFMSQAILPA